MLFHTCAFVRIVAYVQFLVIFNVSRFEASKFDFFDPLYFSLQPGTQQFATIKELTNIFSCFNLNN
jgi:hypothetical protein